MVKRFSLLLVVVFTLAIAQVVQAAAPPGFRLIESAPGVQLFRKDYANGTPDFVQVINLSQGAEIRLLHGLVKEERSGAGVYGGDDPRIGFQSIQGYYRELKNLSQRAFCVTNGQFFLMRESPTRLPFPLKVDGQILTDGYAKQEYPDQKLILELWPNRAEIRPLSRDALYSSDAPNIVAGLTEDARKSPTKYVGRTFVGVADLDGDGVRESVLIFSTKSARQKDAADVLREFGAAAVMMLDGGGSAQLSCQGKDLVASERLLPQALGVIAALPPDHGDYVEMVSDLPPTPAPAVQAVAEPAAEAEAAAQAEPPQVAEAVLVSAGLPGMSPGVSGPLVDDVFDLLWVPLMMGPVFIAVFFGVLKTRGR
jgi:hypothetical protein